MSLWIKICANTTLADAQLAAELGADAVGFVFAPSKRRVTREQVAAIAPHLPRATEKIGVFSEAALDEIAAAVEHCGLTGVQLHFEATARLAEQIRERFGAGLRIVRTVHFAVDGAAPSLGAIDDSGNIDAILVDSKSATASGGTGQAFDWNLAAATLFKNGEARKALIAAGGLRPENVCEAIRVLRPWGVDVASGVEAAPGRKDPARLRAFMANARGCLQAGLSRGA